MKRIIILFLFCCLCVASYSQQPAWFKGISLDSAKLISDSIASMAASKYKFYKVSPAEKEGDYQVFRYIKEGTESKPELLNIAFQFYTDGRPTYYLKKIPDVSLADIFPFWQRFIDPYATLNDVANNDLDNEKTLVKASGTLPAKKVFLSKQDGTWQLWAR